MIKKEKNLEFKPSIEIIKKTFEEKQLRFIANEMVIVFSNYIERTSKKEKLLKRQNIWFQEWKCSYCGKIEPNFELGLKHTKQEMNKFVDLINEIDKKKELNMAQKNKNGEVYTPKFIVDYMLNMIGYDNISIINKHIIDNSCGEGAFLVEIVSRFILNCKKAGIGTLDEELIINYLETYVHGIEINETSYNKCIENLDLVLQKNNINKKVNWRKNILNRDALFDRQFLDKMDFVVGNPPYVKTKDLKKELQGNKKGMIDLYLLFFELGIKMLNKKGVLCYITPKSYLTSKSGKNLRTQMINENLIDCVVDLEKTSPFNNVRVYPIITMLNKNKFNKNVCFSIEDNWVATHTHTHTHTHTTMKIMNSH